MNIVVADIRIGTPGAQKLDDRRIRFQNEVASLVVPDTHLTRLGHTHSFAFRYSQLEEDTAHIQQIIDESMHSIRSNQDRVNLLMVDFTLSSPDLVREPILYHLGSGIVSLFTNNQIDKCIVLLPLLSLPGDESLLITRLKDLQSMQQNFEVFILSRNGDCLYVSTNKEITDRYKESYITKLAALDDDPREQLTRKKVRRMGRFPSKGSIASTRVYSYLIDNCDRELSLLLAKWWEEHNPDCDTILFDTGNIPSMTSSVRAFAEGNGLECKRITQISKFPDSVIVPDGSKCVIVLDVVESGNTLLSHIAALSSYQCSICPEILAVINRGGQEVKQIGDYTVHSFIQVGADPEQPRIMQDELRLPYSKHAGDDFDMLRSFDMWYMAYKIGWEPEQQVPENIGYGYKAVPMFSNIMEEFGDWIAYKMSILLKRYQMPDDVFIIHPKEPGAISVSDRLRMRLDPNTIIVAIPRDIIKAAQAINNNWVSILNDIPGGDPDWLYQLKQLRGAMAIITDIFNASGSTAASLNLLLRQLNIECFCYFPFVDRDNFRADAQKYPMPCLCLYSWYGPRKLKVENGD